MAALAGTSTSAVLQGSRLSNGVCAGSGKARDTPARTLVITAAAQTKKLKAKARAAPAIRKTAAGGSQRKAAPKAAPKPAPKPPGKTIAIGVFSKDKTFRQKKGEEKSTPKLLTRVEELKLLSKLEQAGLLSLLEKNGLSLTKIQELGLLSTAEKFGLLSIATDTNVPGALTALALVLFAAGPAAVYFLPDDSASLVALQAVVAVLAVSGGSAALGGAALLGKLQK
mmetsp:Transcript_33433/g.85428  ORF Transcript_33433/g.85428 Transcript_33433/m.85428 type:complete len:226 (-) Transcript_33433:80-757(-)|eukprot:jgi/Tetstr1/444176/TSEL_032070.t1